MTQRFVTQPGPVAPAPQRAIRRRHFCLVTETYPPEINGVAMTVSRLVDGLRARGHMVSVVRPRQRRSDPYGGEADFRVTLVRGLPLLGHTGVQFGLPAGNMLYRRWSRYRPDGVYVATEGPLGWSAVRAARRLHIPVLSGFHTNFHSYSRYYGAGWLQPVILRYLRAFHNQTQGTLVANTALQTQLRELGIHNVELLARGVDTHLFHPERRSTALRAQWGVGERGVVALYVGRVAPEKNLQLAVSAYRAMQQCNRVVKFVIVGDGPFRATLQKEHPDIHFCGMLAGEHLAAHYASADVFLFPSETETFGNVTLEALASGLAVVAYDYAAAKMHIASGKTGVLLPCGDSNGFTAAAARLVREPKLLAAIRLQARTAVTAADWQSIVERFEALLLHARADSHTIETSSPVYQRLLTSLQTKGGKLG